MEKGIRQFLMEHQKVDPISFHMPGHKGSWLYRKYGYGDFLDKIMDLDITEIPGADNLFLTEGIIKETMDKYAELYDVKRSYLLVNGSSGGLISSILSTVNRGGKLIMARNSHKSIFNALILGNIFPVYAYPETVLSHGILGEIAVSEIVRLMDENPDASAVILPSPNYYGICSDIKSIAEEVHKRGKILIVDQAHGAHLKFMHKYGGELGAKYPMAAEDCGADLVINSTHKTLGSWTQSAILNVCSDRISTHVLEDKLQQIESSSPSYPIMASLDINADIIKEHGEEIFTEWAENVDSFYDEANKIPYIKLVEDEMLDRTKLNFDMSRYGLNGNQLEEELNKRGIFTELVTGNIIMGMSGMGNSKRDFMQLINALWNISFEVIEKGLPSEIKRTQPASLTKVLEQTYIPIDKEFIDIDKAAGRVCAQAIIPYPPGIPIACPGEILDEELIGYIQALRAAGEKVIGVGSDDEILVGRD